MNDAGVFENRVRVNDTVVDNELGGKEVTVWPSWKKMRKGLKSSEFSARKWLEADWAELCTVRWCAAYLCGLGGDWSVHPNEPKKRLELFFSDEMENARGVLQSVTWNRGEENENSEVISVKWLDDDLNYVDIFCEFFLGTGRRKDKVVFRIEVDTANSKRRFRTDVRWHQMAAEFLSVCVSRLPCPSRSTSLAANS